MASSGISRIELEIPIEDHVEATRLLYGRDVLVVLAEQPSAATGTRPGGARRYGLHDGPLLPTGGALNTASAQAPEQTAQQTSAGLSLLHAAVVTVKPIASRQVSRIDLELDIAWHVAATRLLFGQDVHITPVDLQGKLGYGLIRQTTDGLQLAVPGTGSKRVREAEVSGRTSNPRDCAAPQARGGLGTRASPEDRIDPVKWLGARCHDESFQAWLDVSDSEAAAIRVRSICGVSSRREIADDASARDRFLSKIYRPFVAYQSDKHPHATQPSDAMRAGVATLLRSSS